MGKRGHNTGLCQGKEDKIRLEKKGKKMEKPGKRRKND